MIRKFFHPSAFRIEAFLDDRLSASRKARIEDHLERCPRCRAHVQVMRDLPRRLRELPVPAPSEELLERIRASLDAGVEIQLPPEGPILLAPRRHTSHVVISVALFALVTMGSLFVLAPRLQARHGGLVISNPSPLRGDSIELSYRSGLLRSDNEFLIARARLYGEDGRVEPLSVALLPGRSRGRYDASIALPDWAVYGAFAVEDTAGDFVDSNYGRFWEILVHDAEGQPLFPALRQQAAFHFPARLAAALESAQALVSHHPEHADSWHTLYAVQHVVADREELDSLAVVHERRFREFEARFDEIRPPPEEVAAMALYAHYLGDPVKIERWQNRLFLDAPSTRFAVQIRVQDLMSADATDSVTMLDEMEYLWEHGASLGDVANAAFAVAARSGDGVAALLWADRRTALDPSTSVSSAIRLSAIPEARAEGLGRLRGELLRIDQGRDAEEQDRPLGRSVPEHRVVQEQTKRDVLIALGEALIADGLQAAGADTLLVAADLGWNPGAFRTVAEALLADGDTIAGLTLLARVAADPYTDADETSAFAALAERHLPREEWEDRVREGHERMVRQVLSEAMRDRLSSRIVVMDENGARVDLGSALRGEVSVVSLWHCLCEQLAPWIERHGDVFRDLAALDVPFHTVVTGRTPQARAASATDAEVPVLADFDGQAVGAFGDGATPSYFVVDGSGVIRFRHSTPGELRRQVLVLRNAVSATRLVVE